MAYAVKADVFTYAIPQAAVGALTDGQFTAELEAQSSIINSYYRGRYGLPLKAWGVETTRACAILTGWSLLVTRGINPSAIGDGDLEKKQDAVMAWLREVQRGFAHPDVTPSDEGETYTQPDVLSQPLRGY